MEQFETADAIWVDRKISANRSEGKFGTVAVLCVHLVRSYFNEVLAFLYWLPAKMLKVSIG